MRITLLCLIVFALVSAPAVAWERLTTLQGTVVEGDVTQQEFVLIDTTGGEVAVPRSAIERFEASSDGLIAFIKDGTSVAGTLQGKLEIGDGLIKRRYSGTELKRVEFDRFIDVQKGKEYDSCPVRVDIDARFALFGDGLQTRTAKPRAVTCKNMRIATVDLSLNRKIKPGKTSTLHTELVISIPPGEDQLIDVSIRLEQNEILVAKAHKRLTADEGENRIVALDLTFSGEKLDPSGTAPRLLFQLVSQDAEREVEKGGFFWWFAIPIG